MFLIKTIDALVKVMGVFSGVMIALFVISYFQIEWQLYVAIVFSSGLVGLAITVRILRYLDKKDRQ